MHRKEVWTPAQIEEIRRNGRCLTPGIWEDARGDLHFSIPDLLRVFGWPDDERHRALVLSAVREFMAATFPDIDVTETEVES